MIDLKKVAGLIFDYGATIDSNGKHWAEVLWDAYTDQKIPVTKETFREAYVYGERYLALHPVVKPEFTFREVLEAKTDLQLNWLIDKDYLNCDKGKAQEYSLAIAGFCYDFARTTIEKAKPVLDILVEKYPMVLVSNFYGNIEAVLEDFGLRSYFKEIIESAVVGVRKPDPAIFALGVKALDLRPEQVVVVGDSYKKDIAPAKSLGCQTIWIKGPAWEDEAPDLTADKEIYDFQELIELRVKSEE